MQEHDQNPNNMRLIIAPLSGREKLTNQLINIIISAILYIAITLYILSFFDIETILIITILSPLILTGILILLRDYKIQFISFFIYLILFTVLFISKHNLLINGLLLTINQIVETVGIHTGMVLPKYQITVDENKYTLAMNLFWFIVLFFISFFSMLIVNYKKLKTLIFIVFLTVIFHLCTGISATLSYELFLLLSILLLIVYSFIFNPKLKYLQVGKSNQVYIVAAIMVSTILLIFIGLFIFIKPVSNYNKGNIVSTIEKNTINQLDRLRYEKELTNTFTHGNFQKLDELQLIDTPALELIMDKPTSLYLKGFMGTNYTSEQWLELDPENQYHSEELFYSLNKEGFNVYNQLHKLFNVINDSNNQAELTRVTVNNINANSKYIYYPYELETDLTSLDKVQTFADSKVIGSSLSGKRDYQYNVTPNLIPRYPELASKLYDLEKESGVESYLKNESHYNEFVYEHYLNIPEYIQLLLDNHLNIHLIEEDSHINYEIAIHEVRDYLYRKIKYNTEAKSLPLNSDFLIHFLESSREGYSTHYATTATLMFRYLGIPSRYVEGYLVTPTDIKNIDPYEKITITGKNAHAWAEIYIDRIGWIPIEVTPPYYDVMNEIDLTHYPEGHDKDNSQLLSNEELLEGSEGIQEVIEEEENSRNDIKNEDDKIDIWKLLFIILITIVLLLMIFILLYIIKNRYKLGKHKEVFNHQDMNKAIPAIFAYTMRLIHYSGVPLHTGSTRLYINSLKKHYSYSYSIQFEQVMDINQKALYSNQKITDDEYKLVSDFMEDTLSKLKNSRNIWQRVKMKYIDFLY